METGVTFEAIVLAAGAGVRFGGGKLLAPYQGAPLLHAALAAAQAAPVRSVTVVTGAGAEAVSAAVRAFAPEIRIVHATDHAEGMAASLRAGVTTLRQFSRALDGALVALCDQPAFSADIIAQLLAAQRATGRSIVAAHYHGRNAAPALFLREHFATLTALTGEEGARTLLNGDPACPEPPGGRVASVDLPALALDLDTPADYAAWQQRA